MWEVVVFLFLLLNLYVCFLSPWMMCMDNLLIAHCDQTAHVRYSLIIISLSCFGQVFLAGGKFELRLTDVFKIEVAALLSPISRVTIGHDNDGFSAGWYCEKVNMHTNTHMG